MNNTNDSSSSSSGPSSDTFKHITINNDDTQNEQINIDIIQEETNLINYTDNHFNNISSQDLKHLRDMQQNNQYFTSRCDSPLTMSNKGSKHGSSYNSENDDDINTNSQNISGNISLEQNSNHISLEDLSRLKTPVQNIINYSTPRKKRRSKFKELAFHDVEKTLDKYYDIDLQNKFSNELDILTTYIKGQKNIYIQSKRLAQWKLNLLILPSLFITCAITVISPFMECNITHTAIVSALNAVIALLISIINFLKLEANTSMFLQLANQYEKFETNLEINHSKLLVMDSETEKKTLILNIIQDIEIKLKDIKDVNNPLIQPEIKTIFPIISHVNIFSFIKRLENHKQTLIMKFKDVKNEIRYIMHKWEKEEFNSYDDLSNKQKNEKNREQLRLQFLIQIKNNLIQQINDYKSAYANMDDIFTQEIKIAENTTNSYGVFFLCLWKCNHNPSPINNINPILDKYFHFLFS